VEAPTSSSSSTGLAIARIWQWTAATVPAQHQSLHPRLKEAHQALPNTNLVIPLKKVEEACGMDNVEATVQALHCCVIDIEDVAGSEQRCEPATVAEQVISKIDELLPQIRSRQILGRHSVKCQLAQDLAHEAAHVQKLLAGLQAGHY
jgi:hypothetical protein